MVTGLQEGPRFRPADRVNPRRRDSAGRGHHVPLGVHSNEGPAEPKRPAIAAIHAKCINVKVSCDRRLLRAGLPLEGIGSLGPTAGSTDVGGAEGARPPLVLPPVGDPMLPALERSIRRHSELLHEGGVTGVPEMRA